ncbi:hypothetical protein LguiA_035813 [Lonicera macranthoides]
MSGKKRNLSLKGTSHLLLSNTMLPFLVGNLNGFNVLLVLVWFVLGILIGKLATGVSYGSFQEVES